MIRSDDFEITEQELLVYPYPILRLIHEYAIRAIGDIHDLYMLQLCTKAVNFVDGEPAYKSLFGGGTVVGVDADGNPIKDPNNADRSRKIFPFNTNSMAKAKQALSNRIVPAKILLTKFDMDSIDALDLFEQGSQLRGEVFVQGYRYPTLAGIPHVVTTKQDIFRPGNYWLFAPPDFLGKNRVLEYGGTAYKLFIDRRSNVVTFHVYANFGALLANVGSLVRLVMFDPTVNRTQPNTNFIEPFMTEADSIKAQDPLTITADDLFVRRSYLEEKGGRFPVIRQF
jgi:hypothetical protein